jgi:membrane associated rhomboid family serine protease
VQAIADELLDAVEARGEMDLIDDFAFPLPILVIAAWHIGWNVYDLSHPDPDSRINYMAHVSGAVTGIVLGLLYRMFAPQRLGELEMGMGA